MNEFYNEHTDAELDAMFLEGYASFDEEQTPQPMTRDELVSHMEICISSVDSIVRNAEFISEEVLSDFYESIEQVFSESERLLRNQNPSKYEQELSVRFAAEMSKLQTALYCK